MWENGLQVQQNDHIKKQQRLENILYFSEVQLMILRIFKDLLLGLVLLYFFLKYFEDDEIFNKTVTSSKIPKILNLDSNEGFFSSVFCRGSNHTDRVCHFKNLCYDAKLESYLFFHGPRSIVSGVPPDRFTPTLVDFSSAYDHNTLYFNYIEVPSVSISEFNFSVIPGNFLLLKRFNPENLMHVFHDDLIPIFITLTELSFNVTSLVLADGRPPGLYADLYENFLTSKPLYISSLPADKIHCFENAFVGLNKHSTWYQYGFKSPQGPLPKNRNDLSSAILNFRNYFANRFSLIKHPTVEEKAVVLVRKHNRKIINLAEVCQELVQTTKLQTHQFSLEESLVLQIIQEIMSTQVLVGMHGSLLILSMFLPPYSIVLELFPFGIDPMISTPYKTLVEIPGLNLIYKSLETEKEANSISHPEYPRHLGGIKNLPLEEQTEIQNSVVKPFLCCEDPVWLYRVYQDTVVDLPSFISALKRVLQIRLDLLNSLKEVESELYPSEVQNLSCEADKAVETNWICEWDLPWNLKFLKPKTTEYEVWVQDMYTQDVKAFLMKRNSYKFSVKPKENMIYVWVRCYADGKAGPFNSVPYICF